MGYIHFLGYLNRVCKACNKLVWAHDIIFVGFGVRSQTSRSSSMTLLAPPRYVDASWIIR